MFDIKLNVPRLGVLLILTCRKQKYHLKITKRIYSDNEKSQYENQ